MCHPVALAIGSGIAQFAGQRQAAQAQESANNRARQLTLQNRSLQIQTLNNQADEERRRATDSLRENNRAADATAATALVAAGESGVGGLSLDALISDVERQRVENQVNVLQTQSFGQRQRQLEVEGLGITAQSQINQLPIVEFPSFFNAAVSTASNAFSAQSKANAVKDSVPVTRHDGG